MFASLLIRGCFQAATLEVKAGLRLLGRCKGSLHCRASVSDVRGDLLLCGVVCVVGDRVFTDW
jgi:hypothetical protein